MIYSITLFALLVGFVIYHYIKIGKLTDEMINYKVKYESIKAYIEDTKPSSKSVTKEPAKKGRKPKK